MTDFTVYIFLTLVFCKNVVCYTFTSKDGIEISYPIRFKRECRGDMDKIVTLNDIALSDCAIACGKPCPDCDHGKACDLETGKCVHTECVDKSPLMYGIVTGNINKIGSHVKYTCNQGKTTIDAIKCLPNGNWNVTVGASATNVTNVAFRKSTSMSSIYEGDEGSKGVDGITNQSYHSHASCFHTFDDENPYWQVNLSIVYDVFRVVLYNRNDCCSDRARDLDLMFGTSADNMVVVRRVHGQIEDIHTFNFYRGKVARYVKVVLRRKEYLHLCEVQVFGFADSVLGN